MADDGGQVSYQKEDQLRVDPLVGKLRALYDDVANEPLPDGLAELLSKLDEAERNR